MEKILFKDYPDTTTPINAENLNTIQGNIEEDINEKKLLLDNVTKYLVATAESNGDFKINISNVLEENMKLNIKFPLATNQTSNARLSIDDGITYKSIGVQASEVQNTKKEVIYNGSSWEIQNKSNIASIGVSARPVLTVSVAWNITKIPCDSSVIIGNKLTFDSANNVIKIGAGVKKILVTGSLGIYTSPTASETNLVIRKNSVVVAKSYATKNTTTLGIGCGSKIIDVVENDVIGLFLEAEKTGSYTILGDDGVGTYLTVEVVE